MARTKRDLSRIGAWSLIAVFLGGLALPTTLGALRIGTTDRDEIRRMERREPAPVPGLPKSTRDVKHLPESIESWYRDWFGLRPTMLSVSGALRYSVLGVSTDPSRVVTGSDGWLFLGNGAADTLLQSRGLCPLSERELTRSVQSLRDRSQWLAARGIPFVFVVAPDKSSVYGEFLPEWARHKSGPTPLEQLSDALGREDIHFLNLTPSIVAAKSECVTYYKTDTHWNDFGAWTGYRALMSYLREQGIGDGRYRDLSGRRYHLVREPAGLRSPNGLGRQLGLSCAYFPDERVTVNVAGPMSLAAVHAEDGRELSRGRRVQIPKRLQMRETRRLDAAENDLRVLVIRDSFTTAMSPYLSQTFGAVLYCPWETTPGKEMTTLVDRFRPDLVLFIMVQRCLGGRGHGLDPHPNWSIPDGRTPGQRFEQARPGVVLSGRRLADRISKVHDMPQPDVTDRGITLDPRGGQSLAAFESLSDGDAGQEYLLRLGVEVSNVGELTVEVPMGDDLPVRCSTLVFPGQDSIYVPLPRGAAGRPWRLRFGKKIGTLLLRDAELRTPTAGSDQGG